MFLTFQTVKLRLYFARPLALLFHCRAVIAVPSGTTLLYDDCLLQVSECHSLLDLINQLCRSREGWALFGRA